MEITLNDVSGLPDALKPLVTEADGKHTLNLSGLMPKEDLSSLKTALQRERENNSAYSNFGKPDEIKAKLADLEQRAAGKTTDDVQAKLDAMEEKYQGQIGEKDARIERMMKNSASANLKAELAKAGFIAEAVDDIAASALERIAFDDDGAAKVMSTDGKPMLGSGADHGATLADLAKELAESKPYAVRDSGKGGSGKQPGENGGKPHLKKWSEMTSGEKTRLHQTDPQEYERLKASG